MGNIEFKKTEFQDVVLIAPFKAVDSRGGLYKCFSEEQFSEIGVEFAPVEEAFIVSEQGVLRGMHFQRDYLQSKMITCVEGSVQVVVVDVDRKNKTFGKWLSFDLSQYNGLFIPGHYAIGSLAKEKAILYIGYGSYDNPNMKSGIRWDDPDVGIKWSISGSPIVSEKDMLFGKLEDNQS